MNPPTDSIPASSSEGWSPIQGAFWRSGGIAPDLELKDVLPRFTEEAVAVIKKHGTDPSTAEQPLFLYLAYPAPHTPWLPSTEYQGKSGAGMYGDFMMMVDAQVGRVLSTLEEAGMTGNTLLIFASDNGPVWYDADVERFGHDASGGFRGIKGDAWEGGHRMPFIVRWPGVVEMGSVSDQTIAFMDILATIAEVTGIPVSEEGGLDSYSFLHALTGESEDQPIRPSLVMESAGGAMAIRMGNWKLIDRLGSGGFSKPGFVEPGPGDPAGQLYNLSEDPGETTNLYSEHPDVVERLTRELEKIVTETY